MNVTFRQLTVFSEVARLNSVVRASESLHLTPPAVSLQIKAIERELGHILFNRNKRRMTLTVAGEYFIVHARRMLASLREAEDAMSRFGNLECGQLRIVMVSAAKYFLPHLLAKFHNEYPAVDIRLQLSGRDQIDDMLRDNEIDLCIMGRPPRRVPVVAHAFAEHPHVIIISPEHKLAQKGYLTAADLASEAFIVREPESGTRSVLQEYLDQFQLNPDFVMEMASNEAIKQAVMANMGIAFISLHTVALEHSSGLLLVPPVEGLPLMRHWHIVRTASKELSPAASAFHEFIFKDGQTHLKNLGIVGLGSE